MCEISNISDRTKDINLKSYHDVKCPRVQAAGSVAKEEEEEEEEDSGPRHL